MSEVRFVVVKAEEEGQRLDNFLVRLLKGVPKTHLYKLIRLGEVRVNKKRAKPLQKLMADDVVRIAPIRISEEKLTEVPMHLAKKLQDSILYEDAGLLVINKPSGIAVHGGSGLSFGVIEALRSMRTDLSYLELVHRLDRETSGCLVLAKKRSVLRAIQALLSERAVQKKYWAIVHHSWTGKHAVDVDVGLEKNILKSGERMVVVNPLGKPSQTRFQLIENFTGFCWVEATPKTGRTHQIRVHGCYLGHPILGDDKYATHALKSEIVVHAKRLYLHARSIQFNLHDKSYEFRADVDEQFSQQLDFFRQES